MLRIRAKWEAKCPRHPRYNPEKDGEGGIKGGCMSCRLLLQAFYKFRDFVREAAAYKNVEAAENAAKKAAR